MKTISRLSTELIEDAVNDGVIYTELRTTPKDFDNPKSSKRDYIDSVCRSLSEACAHSKSFVRAGVLVSVNRGNSVEDAEEAVDIAYEYSTKKFCSC